MKTSRKAPATTQDYGGFVRRILAAYSRRVGAGDIAALAELAGVATWANEALATAVHQLRGEPWFYTWNDIGQACGVTRQAAQQRWGG